MAGTYDKSTWQTAVDLDFTASSNSQEVMASPTATFDSTRRIKIVEMFISMYEIIAGQVLTIQSDSTSTLIAKLATDVIKQGNIPLGPNVVDVAPDAAMKELGFDLPAGEGIEAKLDGLGTKVNITAVGRVV